MNQPGMGEPREASCRAPRTEGSILSIDYGRERLGLAIASANAKMAQPHGSLERINRNEDMRRLRELAREHRVIRIVVGLPLNLDGTRGEMAEEAERLPEETQGRFLRGPQKAGGRMQRKPREGATVDGVAAAVILNEYLERQAQPAAPALRF